MCKFYFKYFKSLVLNFFIDMSHVKAGVAGYAWILEEVYIDERGVDVLLA